MEHELTNMEHELSCLESLASRGPLKEDCNHDVKLQVRVVEALKCRCAAVTEPGPQNSQT